MLTVNVLIIYNYIMSGGVVGQLGEVEQKLVNLVEEVFSKQEVQKDDEGNECITKQQCLDFIK